MESFILEFVFRTGLIVVATAVVLRALRIRIAATQHSVWAGVLVVMMLLPAWIAWGPKAGVPVLPAQPEMVTSAAPVMASAPETPVFLETLEAPVARPPVRNSEAVFLGVYLLGAVVLLLRLAVGTIRANRLTSASCASPVTVGFFRPRIILPASAVDWPQTQLEAVLTHEREHVHRRDPLFQWLALFNRAVFWFHPVAWWLERKLSALAEEACDDAVLERGHDPHTYSECLLELARTVQQTGARVNVVAMAMPGSGLPQRIKIIIAGVRAPKISRTRMACAVLACAIPMAVFAAGTLDHVPQLLPLRPLPVRPVPQAPVLIAQAQAPAKAPEAPPKLEFEVASIRPAGPSQFPGVRGGVQRGGPGTDDPERLTVSNMPLRNLLWTSYGVRPDQISGPDWLDSEEFDVTAKVPPGTTKEQANVMLQNLLVERFKIALHHTTKADTQAYELTAAKSGSKLKEMTPDPNATGPKPGENLFRRVDLDSNGFPVVPEGQIGILGTRSGDLNRITCRACSIADLIRPIALDLAVPTGFALTAARVADKTGRTGKYDFHLEYLAGPGAGGALKVPLPDGQAEPRPDLFEALERQLGLKLERTKATLDVLVIDHIERAPTGN